MCGRFNVLQTPGLGMLLDSLGCSLPPLTLVNVAPTESVPLVRVADGEAELTTAYWWLTPHWAKERSQKYAMFNARSETAARSPAFRKPFASQRGIVPMSSFIEWRKDGAAKQPWLITNAEEGLAVAALWDLWCGEEPPLLSCTLMTTEAAESFRPWHSRMPVLLEPEEQHRWLDNSHKIAPDDALFAPVLKQTLRLAPLSSAVGNSSHKAPELMEAQGDWVELPAGS